MSSDNNKIAHLMGLVSTTTDALVSIDRKGTVLSWNSSAESMFGYSAESMIGESINKIIPDEYKELHEKGLKRVSSGGEKHVIGRSVELRAMKKSGEEFPISLTLSTWTVEGQHYYGGIIQDISDRVKFREQLRRSELRMRSILESASDAIITADGKGNIISWNKAAQHTFGYSEEEVVGKALTIIIPDEFRESHEHGIERVSSGGPHHVIGRTVELAGLHKDGRMLPIELSLSTWLVEGERFYSGIIRDISERKFAEEIQLAHHLKFQSITESAHDAIISANSHGAIQSWNKAAENIFGYTEQEVEGLPLSIIVPEKYRSMHDAGIKRVASGGAQHVIGSTVELEGQHKDGRLIPIELSLSTWTVNGKIFFSGIIRDISVRKAQEEQLSSQRDKLAKRADELKELNNEVKQKNEQLQALSNKLAKYLSRQVYDNIFEGKKDVRIESYRKKLTVFFSDIEGFTELTDRVESEVLTGALNKYLNEMSKIALAHGGTIDKYIGDAIMIFFGDPESLGEKEDAIACVTMAVEMRHKLIEMRREWNRLGVTTPLRIRMGINTGFCTVGNFGSEERLDYTIVGSSVNLASRLESASEVDEILISQDTYALINDVFMCENKGELKVKGIAYPVNTFKVIDKYENIERQKGHMTAEVDGFNLDIDFDKLKHTDRQYALEILSKALSKLQ